MLPCTCGRLVARRVMMMTCSPFCPPPLGCPVRTFSTGQSRLAWGKMAENHSLSSRRKVLTLDTMNANVKKVEYAVRGPIVQRAVELEKQLREVRRSQLQA